MTAGSQNRRRIIYENNYGSRQRGKTPPLNISGVTTNESVLQAIFPLTSSTAASSILYTYFHSGSRNCRPGDVVIVSGNLGDHHACILSHRMEIENDIKSDCAALNDITASLFDSGIDVKTMRDVTRGGLGTVLNEIADSSGCMIELDEESIPVLDEVRGFTEILGLDPLYMGNEGKMIAVVPGDEAERALEAMRSTVHGKDAQIIGVVKEGSGAYIKTRLGATRRFDVLYGEGLPRIC